MPRCSASRGSMWVSPQMNQMLLNQGCGNREKVSRFSGQKRCVGEGLSKAEKGPEGESKAKQSPSTPSRTVRSTARRQLASDVVVDSLVPCSTDTVKAAATMPHCRALRGDLRVHRWHICQSPRRTSNLHSPIIKTPSTCRLSRGRAA